MAVYASILFERVACMHEALWHLKGGGAKGLPTHVEFDTTDADQLTGRRTVTLILTLDIAYVLGHV